ncbi:MAG: ATP-binding cassette domain-containing protein [Betaproteobacteria bacterium]|nr:ATP-binding cassette domain-containing protein [Betaproteobacteria bacterium]
MKALGLEIRDLTVGYDRADVLSGVSLVARPGEITCLLGANGSGKSTLARAILGLTPPRAGTIRLGETDITGLPTHRVVAQGIGAIPEGRRVFPKLSVRENLRTGAYLVRDHALVASRMAEVYRVFPRLQERSDQLAGTLSGGEQAMLSIGRGLMGSPGLLIIDEPSLGLSPRFVKENFQVIRRINESGVSVLLVEQNVHQTLDVAHRGYVLSGGRVVAEGTADELKRHPELVAAYFGH